MAHKYYEPTDFEQMLLAAGWIDIADLDEDYARYRKAAPPDCDGEIMSYRTWQETRREWDALNAQFETEFPPSELLTGEQGRRAEVLLSQMSWLEVALGY